jgi:TonB family protein
MKILFAAISCLLPLPALAQTNITVGNPTGPVTLVRLNDGGQDCFRYPGTVRRPGASGGVAINYTVGTDGKVSNVGVTSPSGDRQIDRTATDCAKTWKFVPPQAAVTATAVMTFAGNIFHWQTPQVRDAASIALTDFNLQGLKCLRDRQDLAPLGAATGADTFLQVQFFRGEISRVKVISPPGNETLENAAIACFTAIPQNGERAPYLDRTNQVTFTLAWRTLWQQTGASR